MPEIDATATRLKRLRRKHGGRRQATTTAAELPVATLIELMTTSESDSVRIAAAKALLDRSWKDGGSMPAGNGTAAGGDADRLDAERLDAIAAISRLLDELAAAKAARTAGAAGMDTDGTAGTAAATG